MYRYVLLSPVRILKREVMDRLRVSKWSRPEMNNRFSLFSAVGQSRVELLL